MVELSGQPFSTMQQNYGGDSINTAIYLKKLAAQSIKVNYVTAMGSDPLSQALIEKWQQQQLNTEYVLINSNKQPGLYMIQNDSSGERTFQYWRNDSAAKYLLTHPEFSNVLSMLNTVDAIYLSGISLAILPEQDCNALLTHLEELAAKGIKIIYDSNYRPALWSNKNHCQLINAKVYALADLALVTLDDENELWGDVSLTNCTQRLHKQGAKQLVIKTGEDGCQYSKSNADKSITVEQFSTTQIAKVVDTTAAGDSFNAGFLAFWLTDSPISQCALAGNLLAGQVIQQKGAIVSLDVNAIKKAMRN